MVLARRRPLFPLSQLSASIMSNEELKRAREIFLACVKPDAPLERSEFIARECAGDAVLQRAVVDLIEAYDADESFLEVPIDCLLGDTEDAGLAATIDMLRISEQPGSRIGSYNLIEQIGVGGFGVVYMAEQTEPVRRQVALKIIKAGMDTREVIARFEAERQALAMMDHPSIAKVLDGGTTESGRPYFVMDLVHGTPITKFCREANLSTRQRLELFVELCRAVQHAHQKGIIHRDLKPSNVLVMMDGNKPLPKVIDFGVSKALHSPLSENTLFTTYGQMVGTPLYMSPEQAQLSTQDVDVRSDVYALGVLLYELLTGSTPFEKDTLNKLGLDELRRLIREVDPPSPSTRVSTYKFEQFSPLTGNHQIDARKFSQSLKGELDWIVMKSLEKDRNRRYESASALAQDVERYLSNEPVLACPPSWSYQLKKFAARHGSLLAAVSFVLIAMVVSAGFSLWYAIDADKARQLADERLGVADAERTKAERANARSRTLLYVADMKLASDAIRDNDLPRSVELLSRHIPSDGEPDQRGFEWHFFHKQSMQSPVVSLEHDDWVNDMELSPSGKWLAVGTKAGRVQVYDSETWNRKWTFNAGSESVGGLGWSPDGGRLAAACSDGNLRIWNVSSDADPQTIDAHVDGANDVVFAPDGQSLYSCGEDNLAKHWELGTSALKDDFKVHQRAVGCIALSSDGEKLATASSDYTYAIWDAETAKLLYQSKDQGARIVSVAFAADGRVAAGDIEGHVSLFDPHSGEEWVLPRQLDGIEALTFLNQDNWLATADRGGAVQLHPLDRDPEHPDALPVIGDPLRWIAHTGRALTLATTADGKYLMSGGRDGQVRVWTPDVEALRWRAFSDYQASDFATGPENRLYVAGRSIAVWNVEQRRLVETFAFAEESYWKLLAASADGHWLAAVRPGELALFDSRSNEAVRQWPLKDELDPHRLAISPDGRWIAVCGFDDVDVQLYSRENSEKMHTLLASQCETLVFSPNGRWLAAGHMDDLRVFDLNSPNGFRSLKGHSNTLAAASFSPDGEQIATVSHDRLLKIWNFPDCREKYSIVAHQDWARGVAFSPNGRTIATAGHDGQVKFWHAASGQPLGAIRRESENIEKLQFTPDGKRLIAELKTATFAIYDASSALQIPDRLPRSPRSPSSVEFHRLGHLPGGKKTSYVNGISRDGKLVIGHSDSHEGIDRIFWTRELAIQTQPPRLGRGNEQGPKFVENQEDDESEASVPSWPGGLNRSPADRIVVGARWDRDHWRAYRLQAGKTTFLSPSPQYTSAEAVGVTADGNIVLGRVYNTIHNSARQRLLLSEHINDVRPVVWSKDDLEFLDGFDRDHNWWPTSISDDGRVIVGVTWPQGHNFFSPVDYRSGVAFRWEAGEVTLLGSLANYQHSQAFAVSGDGRIVVGTCFYHTKFSKISEIGFVWDTEHGLRSLQDVLAEAGADVVGWEIHRGVAISSDGNTIAGNGVNPRGKKEGWIAQFPNGFFESAEGS